MTDERLELCSAGWHKCYADHLARYLFATRYVEGKNVLDAGTGFGYGAYLLRKSGAKTVTAVDINEDVVNTAKSRFADAGLTFLVDDCQTLQRASGPFDTICNFENIEHLPNPERFLSRATTLLRPEGVLLCSSPDPTASAPELDGKPANPFHVHEWPREDFVEMLSRYFGCVDLWVQVVSLACEQRRAAVGNLEKAIDDLRNMPAMFVVRCVRRLLGRPGGWQMIRGLSRGGPEDFPVVPAALAEALGKPSCHYAICTQPKYGPH